MHTSFYLLKIYQVNEFKCFNPTGNEMRQGFLLHVFMLALHLIMRYNTYMKVALITGGARGIGAATVEKFAKNGYTVILNYNRSVTQAQALRDRLVAEGCDVHLVQADVSNAAQVFAMFDYVGKYFKHLDVLVNNAGVALTRRLQDVTEQDFDSVMDVNAKGTFLCCQHALPYLTKCGGSIVNVASIWGVRGASCESVYAMSKHAVVGLTRSLALELQTTGVKVNAVCPPIVRTDMCAHYTDEDIAAFCAETNTRVYTPGQAAEQIYDIATSGKNGAILEIIELK